MPVPAREDDLKRRARRRLIGAVALMLVAVIVLPLLLEDTPPPGARLDVKMPPPATARAVPKAPVVTAAAPETDPAPAATETDSTPPATADVAPAPPVATSENIAPPLEKPVSKPHVEAKREVHGRPTPAIEPRATIEAKAAPEKTSSAETQGFIVQLGAFSSADKGEALKARAVLLGLPGYTDRAGRLTRVRVGPFPTHAAAEQAATRLAAHGLPGQVLLEVTALDWIVVLILGLSTLRGLMRGMVDTVFSLAAWFLAFIAGRWGAVFAEPLLPTAIESPSLRYFAGFALVFLLVLLAVMLLGYALASTLRAIGLGGADKALGALVGLMKGAMIVIGFTLAAGLTSLPRTDFWRHARSTPWLEAAARLALPLLPAKMAQYVKFDGQT